MGPEGTLPSAAAADEQVLVNKNPVYWSTSCEPLWQIPSRVVQKMCKKDFQKSANDKEILCFRRG
jgi:hypothetical protein